MIEPETRNPFKAIGIQSVKIVVSPNNASSAVSCDFDLVGLINCQNEIDVSRILLLLALNCIQFLNTFLEKYFSPFLDNDNNRVYPQFGATLRG